MYERDAGETALSDGCMKNLKNSEDLQVVMVGAVLMCMFELSETPHYLRDIKI
jgi:hypothetical protein